MRHTKCRWEHECIALYNRLSLCSISQFKNFNCQDIKSVLMREPLYKYIIFEGVMNFQECCVPRICIQAVRSSEKLERQSSASHASFNPEKLIFSLCKWCLRKPYVTMNACCLRACWPIELHLWWSSMSRKFQWLRCWPSSNRAFDQRALALSVFLIRS